MIEESQSTYRTEFPNFGDLDVDLPPGFQDKSSRVDPMPSFIKALSGAGVTPVAELILSIDHADPALRKVQEAPRFTLLVMQDSTELLASFESDNYAEILSGIRIVEAQYNEQTAGHG